MTKKKEKQSVQPEDVLMTIGNCFLNKAVLLEVSRLQAILASRLRTEGCDDKAIAALFGFGLDPFETQTENGIAVIQIYGALSRRGWGITYREIQENIQAALSDSSVDKILLDVDSPGGTAAGCFELCDWIMAQRGQKPMVSFTGASAYSAAFAIASSVDQVFLSRTSGLGSVGVIAQHADWSEHNAQIGLKVTTLFAGDRKNDFNPDEPLSAKAQEVLQAEINALNAIFVTHVAKARGMRESAVLATQAGLFRGEEAVAVGFADGVKTFDEVMEALSNTIAPKSGALGRAAAAAAETNQEVTIMADTKTPEELAAAKALESQGTPPQKAEAPAAVATVVDLDSARKDGEVAARKASQETAKTITALCVQAKCPERAGELIGEGLTADQAREKLFASLTGGDNEVDGKITNPTSGLDRSPTYLADRMALLIEGGLF